MCMEMAFLNQNNFKRRSFVPNTNKNNFGTRPNYTQQNTNYYHHRGPGSNSQNYRNYSRFVSNNVARHDGRNYASSSHIGSRLYD